jgi:hypothetical protein
MKVKPLIKKGNTSPVFGGPLEEDELLYPP